MPQSARIMYKGKKRSLREISHLLGWPHGRLQERMKKRGMTFDEAINLPCVTYHRVNKEKGTKVCPSCKKEKPLKFFKDTKCNGQLHKYSYCRRCSRRNFLLLFHKKRIQVLKHYGGKHPKCCLCGESRVMCLDLDHIHNNGNAHRKSLTVSVYASVIKEGYPKNEYQILCRNCNWLKYMSDMRSTKSQKTNRMIEKLYSALEGRSR